MKRKLTYYSKNLMLFGRNREWLQSDIEWRHKLFYYPSIIQSYSNMTFGNKRAISYLGKKFVFDNPATPLNLQNYPYEITTKILANMDGSPETILDIGGNLGQFSLTLWHVLEGEVTIDIFEPNTQVYPILEENCKGAKGLKAYNYGVGPKTEITKMYYEPGRSGTGSLVRANASDKEDAINEISIKTIHSIKKITGRKDYDLIKIDVEGFEMEVLKTLNNISTKYLFVEMSANREHQYLHSDILEIIRQNFGGFDIVYASDISKSRETFDVLFRFKNKK